MNNGWQSIVIDPKEKEVFEALSDPEWDFRTVPGISTETGLTENEVESVISKYPQLVRKSLVPDRKGRGLYQLRSRGISARERLAEARMFIVKSVQ